MFRQYIASTLLQSTGYSWRCTALRNPTLTALHHRPSSPRCTDGWQQTTNHRARHPSRPQRHCDTSLISWLKSLSQILTYRPKLTRIIHKFQPESRDKHNAPCLCHRTNVDIAANQGTAAGLLPLPLLEKRRLLQNNIETVLCSLRLDYWEYWRILIKIRYRVPSADWKI
jgi:hypothetical protein